MASTTGLIKDLNEQSRKTWNVKAGRENDLSEEQLAIRYDHNDSLLMGEENC